jgi:hypothetical protein
MADKKAHVHAAHAERIVKALPAKVREAAEVKAGGGEYTIIRVNGKTVASVRDRNVRVTHPTDGSADSLKALAKLIGEAAPDEKPEPKPKADKKASKPKAKPKPKEDKEPTAEQERAAEAKIEAEREAEASKAGDAK